ncbi:hypothetical protein HAX54_038566 [Datura stramonium]|uniref:Hexosyltransferase n=1 Tax=Datura stramonium TaxID=4076 RepID=A0ABS8SI97_DATST|nr:hypothetical protein [Datura stramonium]
MNMFMNFTDPSVATRFNANTCTWAFGMNVFDLGVETKHNMLYHKYLDQGSKRPLLKAGSLPIGWMTFKNTLMLWIRHGIYLGWGTTQPKASRPKSPPNNPALFSENTSLPAVARWTAADGGQQNRRLRLHLPQKSTNVIFRYQQVKLAQVLSTSPSTCWSRI